MPTVAGIIVGNEILSGKFADQNGPHLIERTRALGADLMRLVTVPDVRQVIAEEVARCAERFDQVITSGGVGPTHDDVTLESVAMAFGTKVARHPELEQLLERYGLTNPHAMRMAEVPEGSILHRGSGTSFPVVQFQNVWILPGVPKLFQQKLLAVEPSLSGESMQTRRLYTDEHETEIAARLQRVQLAHPSVEVGSYPRFSEGPPHVIVTLESRDTPSLDAAFQTLQKALRLIAPPVE
ncbi:MAG: competence/damage-inducible protein A [Deltaproteobacteria bacterium]|nr:MAG: competence/damage-inducible protein A [Deltaproteobacteria bacterium]